MVTFRDIVGYRPGQAARLLRRLNNRTNPGTSRQPSQPLFPGGDVRLLATVPPQIVGDIGIPIHRPAAISAAAALCDPQPAQEPQRLPYTPDLTQHAAPAALHSQHLPPPSEPPDESLAEICSRLEPHLPVAAPVSALNIPLGTQSLPGGTGLPVARDSISAVCVPDAGPGTYDTKAGSLGGRSFSSDIKGAPLSGVLTPEAAIQPRKPRGPSRPRIKRKVIAVSAPSQRETNLRYHEPRCVICNHPEREAIEQGFLHWQRPSALAHEFGINQRRSIYRHARALGLFQKRASRSRRTLEFIMEQAETVKATADSVIRAVKAHACLSEDGRWTEPRKEIIVTVRYERIDESSPHASVADPPALLPAVQVSGMKIAIPPVPAAARPARRESLRNARPEPSRSESRSQLATRHSFTLKQPQAAEGPRATAVDGNTVPSINAANPSPSTKLQKLMATLSRSCCPQKIAPKKEGAIA